MPFSDGNFKHRIFANIKQDKKAGTIHFEINQGKDEKGNEKPVLIKRDYTGRLKEVSTRAWEYEGKPKESILLKFDDGDSEVWMECGWSIVSKNLLNYLAGAPAIGQVMIALYKNKKGYASVFVEVNGQKVDWKYKLEQLPATKTVKVRGEDVFDDYDQIQFFKKTIIPEINAKIQNEFLVESEMKTKEQSANVAAPVSQPATQEVPENTPDDGLPF